MAHASNTTRGLDDALRWLEGHGSKAGRDGMARYGLPSDRAFGVSVGKIQVLAKRLGKNHDLAEALWRSGWHEARLLAAYVDEPARVTAPQMDRWCRDFDNWGVCDTLCFVLFDRTPHAWRKVDQWAKSREEFVKRAAFALIWSLTVHDKAATDSQFIRALKLIEHGAADDRHFVKKAVNMALRAVGKRNRALNAAAVTTARRLAVSDQPSTAWVGKDALRELTSAKLASTLLARVSAQEGVGDRQRRRQAEKGERRTERMRAKGRRT
jgi:3-methyladenine DNA glycosylase AlkD